MNRSNHDSVIMVFAKAPEPGRVKTRLIPALGETGAVQLHGRLLQHTLTSITQMDSVDVQLHTLSSGDRDNFSDFTGPCSPPIRRQQGSNLGERMANAFIDNLVMYSRVVVVGCDCPALTQEHYTQVLVSLESYDAVIIPALDGGYVLMGLRRFDNAIFENIDWSTGRVMQQTRQQLEKAGLNWLELPALPDIDRPEDLSYCPASLLTGVDHELAG